MIGWGKAAVIAFVVSGKLGAAIVGKDDRKDYRFLNPAQRQAADAVAAMVVSSELPFSGGRYVLSQKTPSYGRYAKLCSGTRFAEQPSAAECGVVLIRPDRIATAGHCARTESACRKYSYVFDFSVRSKNKMPVSFSKESVYACERLVAHSPESDYSIIQLDRPVRGRRPLALGSRTQIGTPLEVLGFPHGLPLKFAAGASILANFFSDPSVFFEANLDIFSGSSGSPVLRAGTSEVLGLVSLGFGEYEDSEIDPVTGESCFRPRRFQDPTTATPAWITRAQNFAEYF